MNKFKPSKWVIALMLTYGAFNIYYDYCIGDYEIMVENLRR